MYKKLFMYGALLCTTVTVGQQDPNKIESLEEVVLIDSKFELKRENSGKVVAKITSEELEKTPGLTIPEVINRISGIEMNGSRSVDGQNLGYYVRGGRNRQVVILVDGVQLNDPSSIANDFDLRLLSLDRVASIEIVKGASSTLYGSGAATAVIHIKTKDPVKEKIGLQLQSSLGTNQNQRDQDFDIAEFDNYANLSGQISKFNYQLSFSHRYSGDMSAVKAPEAEDSFKEDPFSIYNVYSRLGYKINDKLKFHYFVAFDKFNTNFDDAFAYADADNELISEQFRIGGNWEFNYNNGSFVFTDSYSELEREIISDFPNRNDSKVYAFDAHNKYVFNERIHSIIGVNGNFSSFNSFSVPFGENDFAQQISEDVASFDIVDPYINLVYTSDFGFNLNTGTRLNIHSEYGSNWVFNVNPSYSYSLDNGYIKALASYSTAYITPSLFQLFSAQYGNTDLNPEESSTLEAGLEYQAEKLRISGVYFQRDTENFVDFVLVDPANFGFQYQNIEEEFTAKGFELEVEYRFLDNLKFTGNYTFTEPEERFALRIPKHKVNARLGFQPGAKTFMSIDYQFNYERTDRFFNMENFQSETVILDSFGTLDYYISHQANKQLKVFAGVTNITNETYEEIFRFNTRGRNARLGIALSF